MIRLRLVAAVLGAGFFASQPVYAEDLVTIDFESTATGELPSGFVMALTGGGRPVRWVVADDATAPSGGKVLVQTSADTTKYRFPLCVYDGFSASDVTVSVRFKAISGTVDRAAGIVWRYQDANNYYVVRANALEDNVVLYKVQAGRRTDLKPAGAGWFSYGKKVEVLPQRWNELRVTARGERFAIFFNGDHLFDVEDNTFKGAGKVGLWTKADSVAAFDDLTIQAAENR
jgi:hypothetical protein